MNDEAREISLSASDTASKVPNKKRARGRGGKGNYKSKNRSNNNRIPANDGKCGTGDPRVNYPNTAERNAMNDFSWYNRYPELLRAATKVPFVTRPGEIIGPGGIGFEETTIPIPGIMSITYQAAVGSSFNSLSPASTCARGIYDQIRDAYSGNLQTQPADIFMYMMHLDQFSAFIAWCKRLYGILNYYTPYNKYVPYKLFVGMFPEPLQGHIPESVFYEWVAKKNELLSIINQFVHMINKYVFPADFAIFSRHRWMNENIYRDDNTELSQLYIFAPSGFWRVNGVSGENGTEMNFVPFTYRGTDPSTVAGLYSFGISMYQALADWGDVLTINGYLKRAFEGRLMAPIEELPMDYMARPVYSLEVLLQIHNIRVVDEYMERKWTQDPQTHAILVDPQGAYDTDIVVLDLPMDDPPEEAIVIATRLRPVQRMERVGNEDKVVMHCGTEVVTQLTMTTAIHASDHALAQPYLVIRKGFVNDMDDYGRRLNYLIRPLWMLAQYGSFTMAPMLRYSYAESGENSSDLGDFVTMFGHNYNTTLVDKSVMTNMHLVCQQSEFNIYNAATA